MKGDLLHTNTLSPPYSNLRFRTIRALPRTKPSFTFPSGCSLRSFRHFNLLRLHRNPNFKVIRAMEAGGFRETEDGDLLVDTCITRTLPPALTLEHGLDKIKEAVEKLKLNPPCSSSGIYRFQVAVPPSAKALNWFCCQPRLSRVFPQFFLSKEMENPTCESLSLNGTRGVFGIGAAVCFKHSSSCASGEWSSFKRYLSVDSTLITAYGFMDINFGTESFSMKHETGSFYLFIPQIELDEYEGISTLSATLVWSDSSLRTFEEAVHSHELSLDQASHHFWLATDKCHNKCLRSTLQKFNVVEDKTVQMVYMNVLTLGGRDIGAEPMELVSPFS